MRIVNIKQMIEETAFNRFHLGVLLWCIIFNFFDGYDLLAYGISIPHLMKEWSMSPVTAGLIGSYGAFGVLLGSFLLGMLSDKFGRKPTILCSVFVFALSSFLSGTAGGPTELGIYRFICGLGLGGIIPVLASLMSELSPRKSRSVLVSIIGIGFALGGIMISVLSMFILPVLGWRYVYYFGAFPLILIPFAIRSMPESIYFQLAKQQTVKVSGLLARLNPGYKPHETDQFEWESPGRSGFPVAKLFEDRRGFSTVQLWIAAFACYVVIYILNTWLPKIMSMVSPSTSGLTYVLVFNVGVILGGVIGGTIMDRWGRKQTLIAYALVGAAAIILVGLLNNVFLLFALVTIVGATTTGTVSLITTYATQYYPVHFRSTAVGWMNGVGRIGGIVGPTWAGLLLSSGMTISMTFFIFAIPLLIVAIALTLVSDKYGYEQMNRYGLDHASIPETSVQERGFVHEK